MKKKLNLDQLKVQSFVTSNINTEKVLGGAGLTEFSCYRNISCNPVVCLATRNADVCQTITAC